MTILDLALVGIVVLTALVGFRRGLVTGALALAGLIAGAYVGGRVLPDLLDAGSATWLPLVTLGGAITGAVLARSVGTLAGGALRTTLMRGPLRTLDNAGGALLGVAIGLALCWVIGAVLLYLPGQGDLRRHAQDSVILSALNEEIPPTKLIDALERVDPFSAIAGPAVTVDPPEPAIARDPDVRAARASVVRVTGNACGLAVEGSGWIAGPGLVVTNAHVVAGMTEVQIDRGEGADGSHLGRVVAFDVPNDLAVVRVDGLRGPALPRAEAERGVPVAVLGFPENGPYTVIPARVGRPVRAVGRDAYGRFPVTRAVTPIRGQLASGNSGGPAVDAEGRVRTVVFARRDGADGGYGVPIDRVDAILEDVGTALGTRCVQR